MFVVLHVIHPLLGEPIKVDVNTKKRTSHLRQILATEHGIARTSKLFVRSVELEEKPLQEQGVRDGTQVMVKLPEQLTMTNQSSPRGGNYGSGSPRQMHRRNRQETSSSPMTTRNHDFSAMFASPLHGGTTAAQGNPSSTSTEQLFALPPHLQMLQSHLERNPEVLQQMLSSPAMMTLLNDPDLLFSAFNPSTREAVQNVQQMAARQEQANLKKKKKKNGQQQLVNPFAKYGYGDNKTAKKLDFGDGVDWTVEGNHEKKVYDPLLQLNPEMHEQVRLDFRDPGAVRDNLLQIEQGFGSLLDGGDKLKKVTNLYDGKFLLRELEIEDEGEELQQNYAAKPNGYGANPISIDEYNKSNTTNGNNRDDAPAYDPNAIASLLQDKTLQALLSQFMEVAERKNAQLADPQLVATLFDPRTMEACEAVEKAVGDLQEEGIGKRKRSAAVNFDQTSIASSAGTGTTTSQGTSTANGHGKKKGKSLLRVGDEELQQQQQHKAALMNNYMRNLDSIAELDKRGEFSSKFGIFLEANQNNPENFYKSQLQKMRNAGFLDTQTNIAALDRNDGKVQRAIEALLLEQTRCYG
ncbi:unnamed protein product [Amoebophrya sp. A120]|nr:unnamed protein product [Amoebophrya sp. A120]|eukprot:GSA120T00002843001.1